MTGHWIGAGFLLFLGVVGIWLSTSLPVENSEELGSSFFPLLISIFLLILSTINLANLVWRGGNSNQPIKWPQREGLIRMGVMIFLFIGYIGILERLGFIISTLLLIFLFARLVFQKSWLMSGTLSVLAVSSAYALLSELLGVRLPASPWKWI